LGIESRNPKVLDYLNKTRNPQAYISRIDSTVKEAARHLDNLEIGLITGTPVETERDIVDMIDFVKTLKDLNADCSLRTALGRLVVYPGTELWKNVGSYRMIKDQMNYSPYQQYFEGSYDHLLWAVPWNYLIHNPNFSDHSQYTSMLNLAFREAES
jgi:radical SAM superfamily enzyme YgiQ (UPF0313 family)